MLLLWIVGATNAGAVITNNYKEVFNTPIDTSDPEFIPALGWGHYTEGFEKTKPVLSFILLTSGMTRALRLMA